MTAPYFSASVNIKQVIANLEGLSSQNYTLGMRLYVSSTVGGGNQVVFNSSIRDAESGQPRPRLQHLALVNTYVLLQDYATARGRWSFSCTDNQWHSMFIVHERSGVGAIAPIVYIDKVTAPVAVVSLGAGAVTFPSATAGWVIGGFASFAGGDMRGFLQHVVWANSLWTKQECDQFASAPGSFMQDVEFYYPFARADHHEDYGGQSHALTATGGSTSGPTDHNATVSGGLRMGSLLRVGL